MVPCEKKNLIVARLENPLPLFEVFWQAAKYKLDPKSTHVAASVLKQSPRKKPAEKFLDINIQEVF